MASLSDSMLMVLSHYYTLLSQVDPIYELTRHTKFTLIEVSSPKISTEVREYSILLSAISIYTINGGSLSSCLQNGLLDIPTTEETTIIYSPENNVNRLIKKYVG